MAVMQNSIIFGGVDSADFGIYIGGEGTFNAPKRDVEMISIPGRNGAFALDKGRFENIEVTYSAFNYEKDLATFARQLSDFRNAICSQKGYQRLTDTFHLEEYRMATYLDGLEIKPVDFNTAATFDIVFNCKPQRYLLSGEEAIDVTSGDTILNPTLFESKPMLEVEGYGTIGFNGFEIELTNEVLGNVEIASAGNTGLSYASFSFNPELFNAGDTITLDGLTINAAVGSTEGSIAVDTISDSNSDFSTTTSQVTPNRIALSTKIGAITFVAGTASIVTNTTTVTVTGSKTATITTNVEYYIGGRYDLIRISYSRDQSTYYGFSVRVDKVVYGAISGVSSVSVLGHPTYIDCDLGEAYLIKNDMPISLNRYIDLGSELPTFAVGSNEITFDNTITDLKVTPRWWIV